MTISTYPIQTGVEAYIRQSKVRIRTADGGEGAKRERFQDIVTLSGKDAPDTGNPVKYTYTWEELFPPPSPKEG